MENADPANANEAVEVDEVGVGEPAQHRDDEIDSSVEEEEEMEMEES